MEISYQLTRRIYLWYILTYYDSRKNTDFSYIYKSLKRRSKHHKKLHLKFLLHLESHQHPWYPWSSCSSVKLSRNSLSKFFLQILTSIVYLLMIKYMKDSPFSDWRQERWQIQSEALCLIKLEWTLSSRRNSRLNVYLHSLSLCGAVLFSPSVENILPDSD